MAAAKRCPTAPSAPALVTAVTGVHLQQGVNVINIRKPVFRKKASAYYTLNFVNYTQRSSFLRKTCFITLAPDQLLCSA